MKTHLNPLSILLLGIILVLSIFCVTLWLSKNEYKRILSKPLTELKKDNPEVKRYLDSSAAVHVVFKDRIITKHTDLSGALVDNQEYIDSIARALNIKASQLSETINIVGSLKGEIKAYRVMVDSLKNREYFFKQKYLTASFNEADSILKYKYDPEISIARTEKKNIFGQVTSREIDISSPDPNLVLDKLKQFRMVDPAIKKSWGIGIQVGYYYDPVSNRFIKGFGVGLSKNLFSF